MKTCEYPGCGIKLTPGSRGRPARYCIKHARARKREQDMARRFNSREPESIYERLSQCCIDWRKAGRRNRKYCPQHQEWFRFSRQSRDYYRSSTRLNGQSIGQDADTIMSLIETGKGVRVHANPDSWMPIDSDDIRQDKALAEWIKSGNSTDS